MPQWTPQQNNAITARNRNILVSAAAGSGKTAVLVERVIGIITDPENPVDIDKLLIVTFTNAAAAEMKARISRSLTALIKEHPGEPFYKKQLSLLPSANICTIDSFCSSIVKEHFYDLSISRDFSTFDESELLLLEDNVISNVIDDFFEKGDNDFISLFEHFTSPGNEKPFITAVKHLLRFIYAQPFPYLWLDKALENYNPEIPFNNSVWFSYIQDEIKYLSSYALELAEMCREYVDFDDEKLNEKFSAMLDDDISEIARFAKLKDYSWNELINQRPAQFMRMPSSSKADKSLTAKIKANRDIYKSIVTKDIQSLLISDEEEYKNDIKILYRRFDTLIRFVKEVDKVLMEEKREINTYSFSDIEHFAISLLFRLNENNEVERTPLASALSENYYEILVDEYQDTNEAQDLLFTYLSNGSNLFTVGDIKQSIYRFRLAMPHIFNEKKNRYSHYDKNDSSVNSKIILDKNFRSRSGICSYVNFTFSNLMTSRLGELDYNEEEYLNCGASYCDTDIPCAQLKILTGIKGEEYDKAEALYIAKTIKNKVESGELITDGGALRPVRYGDFAILMRKVRNHIDTYSKVLTEQGIPVICDNSSNLFENNEIRILLSILRVIDNPIQDVALLSAMMSPIYGFTADELAEIRINCRSGSLYNAVRSSKTEKAIDFLQELKDLKKISVTMPVAAFIRYLVEEKGLIACFNALGNGEQRYQNILKLVSFAEKFDSGVNVGLTAFLRYIDKIMSSDKGVESASLNPAGNDCVTIMTVHHSKGLEFPICIFAGTSRQYNKQDLNDRLLLNTAYGIGLKCHNEEGMYEYNPIPYAVIKSKNSTELMSENLRVLYVAMTRAKEQFISFVTVDNLESKIKRLSANLAGGRISPYSCKKVNSDADFLLMCALIHKDGNDLRELSPVDFSVNDTDFDMSVEITDSIEVSDSTTEIEFVSPDENVVDEILNKLSYSYERQELSVLSSKLTASSLDDADRGFEYLTSSKPAFMNKSGLTPAQRGTAMHTFMQYCDYSNSKVNLENEISRLIELGYLTDEQAQSLDRQKLNNFFLGALADEIFDADKVYREIKISSFVSTAELYGSRFDEQVLVQGIADCVIEKDGMLTLIDYKTDNISSEDELLDRYKKQIMFYKNAVEKALEMPVKSALLYSFSLGKSCYYK